MAPWTKVAIDERVGEQEVLGLSWRFEALHLPFPAVRRSVRVLSAIVIMHNFTRRHWRSMKSASSEESVGDVRLRQFAECMIQGDFRDVESAEP